jgi:hypothetical protein
MPAPANTEGSPKELTDAEIRQIILSAPNAKIIPPKDYNPPDKFGVDESQIPDEEARNDVNHALRVIRETLDYPIITDGFKSHDQRRQWRLETEKLIQQQYGPEAMNRFSQTLARNRLKGNAFSTPYTWLDFMRKYLPEEPLQKLDKIKTKYFQLSSYPTLSDWEKMNDSEQEKILSKWNQMDSPAHNQEKIEVIDQISQAFVQILNHFSQE